MIRASMLMTALTMAAACGGGMVGASRRAAIRSSACGALANGAPAAARLNGFDNADIYDAGFLIGEFIVSRWGQGALAALIRNNGNTALVTGLGESAFFAAWYEYVRAAYFSSGADESRWLLAWARE